ncbi:hypothetical protein M231_00372 [Tremella mesenterica]|uniref:Uncharacterized protein n=1 Tax=Tremella mesenterica TaxID=5217 RepID=A0A4Q1BWC2_TREME|nr:hypothetical protein M231_00372 [Tremella mesenterica]
MFKLATFFYSLMLAGAASAISLPVKGRGEGMTNADRLKRGLPLRSLTSPYNASRVNAAPAKRSDANQIAYLQAVPPEARKRSPYTQTSYLFYDRDAGIFRLTTDQTQASPFIVPEYGVEEYLYYQRDDTVYPLCSSTWSGGEANNMETDNPGGSTAIVFTLCGSTRPVDQSYGTNTQTPIWTIPPRDFWPAPAGFTYHNADESKTQLNYFFAFIEYGLQYVLGGAIGGNDIGADSYSQINLRFIASLPS